jgi:hypothetical protein
MWNDINILIFLVLFIVYFTFDVVYSHYIIAIQHLNAIKAGILSIVIGTISAIGIVKLADNPFYSVPIVLGGGLGTYFIIKWEKKKKQKRDIKK